MTASDTDDDYEYAVAKWMFVPHPVFALSHFAFVFSLSYIALVDLIPEVTPILLFFIILEVCISILCARLMIKEFTTSIREGFCSPSGDQIVRCGFWRTLAIWFLVSICLPRRASAVMSHV
jgi:hypothetical protein